MYAQAKINGTSLYSAVVHRGYSDTLAVPTPTVSAYITTENSITWRITNNANVAVTMYHALTSEGLTPGTAVSLSANGNGTYYADILVSSLVDFTQYSRYAMVVANGTASISTGTIAFTELAEPTITQHSSVTDTNIYWRITNNSHLICKVYYEMGDSDPDLNLSADLAANGGYVDYNPAVTDDENYTLYAKAYKYYAGYPGTKYSTIDQVSVRTLVHKPEINFVSKTANSVTFTATNNSASYVDIYAAHSDTTPNTLVVNSLAPGATSGNFTISGLSAGSTYGFSARARSEESPYNYSVSDTESYTTTAQWTASFAGLTGATPSSYADQTIDEGGTATSPGSPTKAPYYTFNSWSPAFAALYADQIYTAQWDQVQLDPPTGGVASLVTTTTARITFWNDDDRDATIHITLNGVTKTVEVVHWESGYCDFTGLSPGTEYTATAYTSKTGYADSTTANATAFTTDVEEYTVWWENWDGSALETDLNVPSGTTPTYNGSTPTRASTNTLTYSFTGWSPTVGAISGNTTYTAQFSSSTRYYNVYWRKYSTLALVETDTVQYGATAYKPTSGGTTNTAQYTYYWSPTSVVVYATQNQTEQRSLNYYTITFDANGGSGGTAPSVPYGTGAGTLASTYAPTPTRSGYRFAGWSPSLTTVTGTKTYSAIWVLQVTATFAGLTGASPSSYSSQTVDTGGTITSPGSPTKSGYTFDGWSPTLPRTITTNTCLLYTSPSPRD